MLNNIRMEESQEFVVIRPDLSPSKPKSSTNPVIVEEENSKLDEATNLRIIKLEDSLDAVNAKLDQVTDLLGALQASVGEVTGRLDKLSENSDKRDRKVKDKIEKVSQELSVHAKAQHGELETVRKEAKERLDELDRVVDQRINNNAFTLINLAESVKTVQNELRKAEGKGQDLKELNEKLAAASNKAGEAEDIRGEVAKVRAALEKLTEGVNENDSQYMRLSEKLRKFGEEKEKRRALDKELQELKGTVQALTSNVGTIAVVKDELVNAIRLSEARTQEELVGVRRQAKEEAGRAAHQGNPELLTKLVIFEEALEGQERRLNKLEGDYIHQNTALQGELDALNARHVEKLKPQFAKSGDVVSGDKTRIMTKDKVTSGFFYGEAPIKKDGKVSFSMKFNEVKSEGENMLALGVARKGLVDIEDLFTNNLYFVDLVNKQLFYHTNSKPFELRKKGVKGNLDVVIDMASGVIEASVNGDMVLRAGLEKSDREVDLYPCVFMQKCKGAEVKFAKH